jgi:hypothetical protein
MDRTLAKKPSLRDQHFHRLAQQLAPGKPEQALGLGIHHQDPPLSIDEDHGVRGRFEERPEQGLRPLPIADVANGAHREHAVLGFQGAQADLHRKLAAILSEAEEREARPHRAGSRVGEIPGAGVTTPESLRYQDFKRLPKQLIAAVPEEPLGLRIHQHDAAQRVDDHDRVGDELEQIPEPRLNPRRLVEAPHPRHPELSATVKRLRVPGASAVYRP